MKRYMGGGSVSVLVWSAAVTAGVTLAGCAAWAPLFDEVRVVEADYGEAMGIDVKTRNGRISVERADVQLVEINATIKARSEERLQNTRVVAEHDETGTLVVRVEWPDGKRKNREGCSFEIRTPGAYGVALDSSNGSLRIRGLSGEAVLDSSNGSLTVEDHQGDVQAYTSNGAITLNGIDGSVTADTSNGKVRVLDVAGSVDVDTSNGSVTVELAADSRGPVRADTSNGSVNLVVNEQFVGELVLDTSNGGISFDAPATVSRVSTRRNHAVLQFGEGGPKSVVSTSNGSIKVRTRSSE